MFAFIKKLFSSTPVSQQVPYKVEVAQTIKEVEVKVAKKTGKKPAAKKTTPRKPRAKKAE
jgi:hypothetical protein